MSEPFSILRIAAQLTGGGPCDNCGQPFASHCTACLIPCCPGKCAARGEIVTEYDGLIQFIDDYAAGRLLAMIFGQPETPSEMTR